MAYITNNFIEVYFTHIIEVYTTNNIIQVYFTHIQVYTTNNIIQIFTILKYYLTRTKIEAYFALLTTVLQLLHIDHKLRSHAAPGHNPAPPAEWR